MPYKDKEMQRASNRRHYQSNKASIIAKVKLHKESLTARNYEYVNALKDNPCTDCSKKFPATIMHFDHLEDNKRGNIADMTKSGYSIKTIQEEIDKCELVCETCHAYRTNNRLKQGIQYNLPQN